MTDIDIIIAIGKACGWTVTEEGWWINPEDTNGGVPHPPDYCHDLNAMHEAEKAIDREFYVAQLLAVIHEVDADYFNKVSWENGYELATATARQRAEAFLRVKGLWKE